MTISLISKLVSIHVIRALLRALRFVFPIDKRKILFVSFGGKSQSCSPYYIYKYLKEYYSDSFDFYWASNSNRFDDGSNTNYIMWNSISSIYHVLKASCIITNDTFPTYIPISDKQLFINTWHGGGLFKQTFGNGDCKMQKYNDKIFDIHDKDTKLYISSSNAWSEKVARFRFRYTGEILECGLPRNDIFFRDSQPIVDKVKKYYNINKNCSIVLYAPTFRGNADKATLGALEFSPLDIESVINSLGEKYGKSFIFIFRGHHTLACKIDGCINASSYPDMQELLVAADVLISDYSSCLWDFSLTRKPCFIYAPDFDQYLEKPGFESDYREWPFIITKSNEQLKTSIKLFDDLQYKGNVDKYHEKYGSFESGQASSIVSKYICNHIYK